MCLIAVLLSINCKLRNGYRFKERQAVMNKPLITRETIESVLIHSIAPTIIALMAAAFFFGGLNNSVKELKGTVDTIQLEVTALDKEVNEIRKKPSRDVETQTSDSPVTKAKTVTGPVKKRRVGFRNNGPWGDWSEGVFCDPGEYVCGLEQRVEPNQKKGDDSAMNAVAFYCCSDSD